MEKLKAKHDHKLTDILKVAIFGLMLILPGLILLPSMLYYGVNEHATAPTEQVEKVEYERVYFNQIYNGNGNTYGSNGNTLEQIENTIIIDINTNTGNQYFSMQIPTFKETHKYFVKSSGSTTYAYTYFYVNTVFTPIVDDMLIQINGSDTVDVLVTTNNNFIGHYEYLFNIYDITQMFGYGKEPTTTEFAQWYNDYYEYTEGRYEILEIPTGTYETYTDITSQIQFNWNSLWQQPLFNWTNYTILKQGLDKFTNVFGITENSYINNLITYEIIMVAIYIVIDIVLTLFKWLTHLIGEK